MPEEKTWLDRLLVAVSKHKDEQYQVKSWWRWFIVIALVLFAVAIYAWLMRRGSKELARLRHEKKKARLAYEQSVVDAEVAVEERLFAEYAEKIDASSRRLEEIDAQMLEVEERNAKNNRTIDDIRTWDDAGVDPPSAG